MIYICPATWAILTDVTEARLPQRCLLRTVTFPSHWRGLSSYFHPSSISQTVFCWSAPPDQECQEPAGVLLQQTAENRNSVCQPWLLTLDTHTITVDFNRVINITPTHYLNLKCLKLNFLHAYELLVNGESVFWILTLMGGMCNIHIIKPLSNKTNWEHTYMASSCKVATCFIQLGKKLIY